MHKLKICFTLVCNIKWSYLTVNIIRNLGLWYFNVIYSTSGADLRKHYWESGRILVFSFNSVKFLIVKVTVQFSEKSNFASPEFGQYTFHKATESIFKVWFSQESICAQKHIFKTKVWVFRKRWTFSLIFNERSLTREPVRLLIWVLFVPTANKTN